MSSTPTSSAFDFVIVGGGHNGLSAACTLSASGASVQVLEGRDHLGGLANSGPFLPEAPDHILSLGAMDDMFMSCTSFISDLGLQRYGYSGKPVEASQCAIQVMEQQQCRAVLTDPSSPVDGYYHAGAGSHPGGGVSGWPGRLAAETALGLH